MEYVIGGWLNKQIAAELAISEKTVKVHRGCAMHKMDVHSVAERSGNARRRALPRACPNASQRHEG